MKQSLPAEAGSCKIPRHFLDHAGARLRAAPLFHCCGLSRRSKHRANLDSLLIIALIVILQALLFQIQILVDAAHGLFVQRAAFAQF